jgi:hypothetical protein
MTRNQFATIHIMKKEAGLNEFDYRALLMKNAGVSSSKDISSEKQYQAVIAALENKIGKKALKVKPKEVRLPKFTCVTKPVVPWEYRVVNDAEWANFANYMTKMEKKGIAVVAVWDADGTKRFKSRPIRK